jgi:hypothetical protein
MGWAAARTNQGPDGRTGTGTPTGQFGGTGGGGGGLKLEPVL